MYDYTLIFMITITWFIVLATFWFLFLVLLKSKLSWKFCAVCVAISSIWLALLIMRFAGKTVDPLLIAVLMGESVVGFYYFLEKRVPTAWQIFRWPYLITATIAVYVIIGTRDGIVSVVSWLGLIWVVFGLVYAIRSQPVFKKIAERLIACCRDW